MECPIKNHAYETTGIKGKHATRDCIKSECAWWDTIGMCCAVLSLANAGLTYRGSFAKYVEGEDQC